MRPRSRPPVSTWPAPREARPDLPPSAETHRPGAGNSVCSTTTHRYALRRQRRRGADRDLLNRPTNLFSPISRAALAGTQASTAGYATRGAAPARHSAAAPRCVPARPPAAVGLRARARPTANRLLRCASRCVVVCRDCACGCRGGGGVKKGGARCCVWQRVGACVVAGKPPSTSSSLCSADTETQTHNTTLSFHPCASCTSFHVSVSLFVRARGRRCRNFVSFAS